MRIPVKITPDNLLDTIVEIRYNLNIPQELVPGIIYKALPKEFIYPKPKDIIPEGIQLDPNNPEQKLFLGIDSPSIFSNGEVKIQVRRENNIIFNCIGEYIGWEKYFGIIKDVLTRLSTQNIFHSYDRVGVRYISKFDNISIFDKLKGSFNLVIPNKEFKNTTFRTEYMIDDKRVIVNLSNNIQRKNEAYSLFDIDVLKGFKNTLKIEELFEGIDETHKTQKETFFQILNENFLKSLNPEYL